MPRLVVRVWLVEQLHVLLSSFQTQGHSLEPKTSYSFCLFLQDPGAPLTSMISAVSSGSSFMRSRLTSMQPSLRSTGMPSATICSGLSGTRLILVCWLLSWAEWTPSRCGLFASLLQAYGWSNLEGSASSAKDSDRDVSPSSGHEPTPLPAEKSAGSQAEIVTHTESAGSGLEWDPVASEPRAPEPTALGMFVIIF